MKTTTRQKRVTDPNIKVRGNHVYTEETLYTVFNKSKGPFYYTAEDEKVHLRIDPWSTRTDINEFSKAQIMKCDSYAKGLICFVDPDFAVPTNQFTEDTVAELVKKWSEAKEPSVITNFVDTLTSEFALDDFLTKLKGYSTLPQYFEVYTQAKIEELRMKSWK